MNIFVLSKNLKRCAMYHVDSHVIKLILESAQILCSAHIILDSVFVIDDVQLYKLTHKNHPCTIWARTTSENYKWLYNLFVCLCEEYTYRYGKIHLTERKLRKVLENTPKNITEGKMTDFALAMPDYCKRETVVESYRKYYVSEKIHLFKWTKRDVPYWYGIDEDIIETDEE